MKVNLTLSDLELVPEEKVKMKRPLQRMGETGMAAAQQITTEISLRGMTVDEALYDLEKYLDQAILAGLSRFRVIHGKGTGVLRQAVQQYLKENPMVKSVQFAEQNEGGLGATIVEIRR
jgi:DNA mismatch repair protein MutS2